MKTFNFRDDHEELMKYLQTLDEYDSLKFKFIGDKILIFSRANTYQVMSFAYAILDFDFETAEIPDHSESHIKLWSKASHVIISVTSKFRCNGSRESSSESFILWKRHAASTISCLRHVRDHY